MYIKLIYEFNTKYVVKSEIRIVIYSVTETNIVLEHNKWAYNCSVILLDFMEWKVVQ